MGCGGKRWVRKAYLTLLLRGTAPNTTEVERPVGQCETYRIMALPVRVAFLPSTLLLQAQSNMCVLIQNVM